MVFWNFFLRSENLNWGKPVVLLHVLLYNLNKESPQAFGRQKKERVPSSFANQKLHKRQILGVGFQYVFFSPLFVEDSHFDSFFSKGLVQPPTTCSNK